MTYNVLMATLNPTHSPTHSALIGGGDACVLACVRACACAYRDNDTGSGSEEAENGQGAGQVHRPEMMTSSHPGPQSRDFAIVLPPKLSVLFEPRQI